jgi:hypothetical protein
MSNVPTCPAPFGSSHVCGVDRSGKFALIRIPSVKSCRKFLIRTHEWLRQHMHWANANNGISFR